MKYHEWKWLRTYFLPPLQDLCRSVKKFVKKLIKKGKGTVYTAPEMRSDLFYSIEAFLLAENERNAPNARKSNDCINDPTEKCSLTAADPCYEVKLEKTDASPVKSSDHSESKRYSVYYHHNKTSFSQKIRFLLGNEAF